MSWEHFKELNDVKSRYKDASIDKCILPKSLINEGRIFIQRPHSWILNGEAGRGKTYFSYCLIRGVVDRFGIASTRWFKSKVLDDKIIQDMSQYGSASYFIQGICEVPILFIDDFGVDRDTERAQRDYYEIIDSRWEDERPTVITTNLTPTEIEKLYGSRIFSRMKDFKWTTFKGSDLRGANKCH